MTIKKPRPVKYCKLERYGLSFTPKVPWQDFCMLIKRLDRIEKAILEFDIRLSKIEQVKEKMKRFD